MATLPDAPSSRMEQYLAVMAQQEGATRPVAPSSRVEQYLDYICENGTGGASEVAASYSALVTTVNAAAKGKYKAGTSFFIETADVPDVWVKSVENTAVTYTYTTDAAFLTALNAGTLQIGYCKFLKLEGEKITVDATPTSGSTNPVSSGGVYTALAGKQDSLPAVTNDRYMHTNSSTGALEWIAADSIPTSGSTNLITSGAVYTAMGNIETLLEALL